MVLDKINKPNDIKKISPREYKQLASENTRKFLIEKISKTGGQTLCHRTLALWNSQWQCRLYITFQRTRLYGT